MAANDSKTALALYREIVSEAASHSLLDASDGDGVFDYDAAATRIGHGFVVWSDLKKRASGELKTEQQKAAVAALIALQQPGPAVPTSKYTPNAAFTNVYT